jgi:hypothetical protein
VPYYSVSAKYCYHFKTVGVVSARSIKSCSKQAVHQEVFTDVLTVGRLDVHGQSFAPIGLHKIDAASDWLLIKRVYEMLAGNSVIKLIGQQQLSA